MKSLSNEVALEQTTNYLVPLRCAESREGRCCSMDRRVELLDRVRLDAEALAQLASSGTNIPLNEYVDRTSLDALCDALSLDPENWNVEDLERILLIRDGLYSLRNKLRDTDEEAAHSVERILSATDRLYTDLERAFREINVEELKAAKAEIAAHNSGPQLSASAAPNTTREVSNSAAEIMTRAHTSLRHLDLSLTKIDRSNPTFEIFKSVKLSIQRLSASAFAIKLTAEQTIIYHGVVKLLNDGADRIVAELKRLIDKIQSSYERASTFISELSQLADQGTRFSRIVGDFLNKAFVHLDRKEDVVVQLKVQVYHSGEAILCAAPEKDSILLVGKNGNAWTADPTTRQIRPRFRVHDRAVFAVKAIENEFGGEVIAIGTEDGVQILSHGVAEERYRSSGRERVVSIVSPPWGAKGSRGTIVSGSSQGTVRRWTLAQDRLSQMDEQSYETVGRRLQCMTVCGRHVVAASQRELIILDHNMNTLRTVKVPYEVSAMDAVNEETLVMCGEGNLAVVSIAGGTYSRILTASEHAKYCCVAVRDPDTFYFGTEQGRVGIMQLSSGIELGSVEVDFPLRGIVLAGDKVLAYGGEWNRVGKPGRSAAFLTVDTKIEPVVGQP